jgi:hypothetical protein
VGQRINLGNVTPTIDDGGVTISYAEQTVVLSPTPTDQAARSTLAALALLQIEGHQTVAAYHHDN